ncbi:MULTISPECIES: DUF2524 family protein [Bacillaceae]|uniref:DUF2524 family protein n=1 Tax=Evansella alkalicola TaxID=745819 RepID=A0ABS6JRH5_9BACI|nr:DUF2524 family protein [Litchfieldia alkalitelluris]MBU9721157.1 DUF2524 family protein [Bacillus alkalicola]
MNHNSGQIENYINKVKNTIENAQKELAEVKMIRENDPTEFSYLLHELQELQQEMPMYIQQASPVEKEKLLEAKEYLQYTQEVMEKGI